MPTNRSKTNARPSAQAAAGEQPEAGTARDREMGRDARPLGDLGAERTWAPPSGAQGISNRPDDGAEEPARPADASAARTTASDPPDDGVPSQQGGRGFAQDERPDDEKKTSERGGRS